MHRALGLSLGKSELPNPPIWYEARGTWARPGRISISGFNRFIAVTSL
jgi:hypothetical protein